MTSRALSRRTFLGLSLTLATPLACHYLAADEPQRTRDQLKEPVFRVANKVEHTPNLAAHPLDPAIQIAKEGLAHIRQEIRDYECLLVKQERIKGELKEPEYIFTKVRNRQFENGMLTVPFAVYLSFAKPSSVKGREVIWVEGKNNGKMIAHEGNFLKTFGSVWLDPNGSLAMKGNLYPVTDVGVENLLVKLVEKAERDRRHGECEVDFRKASKVNDRVCTMLRVVHPQPRSHFDFHIAEVFIDDELNVPIRYAAYGWPTVAGGEPPLNEAYTYLKLKTNVGLSESDFDYRNTKYKF